MRLDMAPMWLRILGGVWTSPNTLIGLIAGALGSLAGARPYWSRKECALVFRRWPWGPGGAITFGMVILHTGNDLNGLCQTYEHRAGR